MNRLLNFKQSTSLRETFPDNLFLDIKKIDSSKIRITHLEIDSATPRLNIPFTTTEGIIISIDFPNEWTIDLNKTGLDQNQSIGGILDGLVLASDQLYHIWAFADENGLPKGFGITQRPESQFTCPAALQGEDIVLSDINSAYRYAVGSTIDIRPSDVLEWNQAVVTNINSGTQLTARLGLGNNNTDISAQGTAGGNVVQMNYYRPYKPNTQSSYYPFFNPIGSLRTNSESPITLSGFQVEQHLQKENWSYAHPMTFDAVSAGSSWAAGSTFGEITGRIENISDNDGNAIYYDGYISAGFYDFSYFASTKNDRAIVRVMIDQELLVEIDLYENPPDYNYPVKVSDYHIPFTGRKRITFMANGKTGMSTGYQVVVHGFSFRRVI